MKYVNLSTPPSGCDFDVVVEIVLETRRRFVATSEYKALKEQFKDNPSKTDFLRAAKRLRVEIQDKVKLDDEARIECHKRARSKRFARLMNLPPGMYAMQDGRTLIVGGTQPDGEP